MNGEPIISLHDPRGIVVWINKAPEGVTPEEVVGTTPWQWVQNGEKTRVKAHFATCIALGESQHFQSPALVKGRTIQLDVRIDPTGGPAIPIIARTRVQDAKLSLLTKRELDILRLMGAGCDGKEITRRLDISRSTLDTYRSRMRSKLRIESLSGLAIFASEAIDE